MYKFDWTGYIEGLMRLFWFPAFERVSSIISKGTTTMKMYVVLYAPVFEQEYYISDLLFHSKASAIDRMKFLVSLGITDVKLAEIDMDNLQSFSDLCED